MIQRKSPIAQLTGDATVTIASFVLMIDNRNFGFRIGVFVRLLHALCMIIKCRSGKLCYFKQQFELEFLPQLYNHLRFFAGVARFPKPRLASFLGTHSPLEVAAPLPANLLPPLLATLSVGLCCLGRGAQFESLPGLPSNISAPNPVFYGGYLLQIAAKSLYS